MKNLNDILVCKLKWIEIELKLNSIEFKFNWMEYKFNWGEMGCKLVQKALKHLRKKHNFKSTPSHSSLLGNHQNWFNLEQRPN